MSSIEIGATNQRSSKCSALIKSERIIYLMDMRLENSFYVSNYWKNTFENLNRPKFKIPVKEFKNVVFVWISFLIANIQFPSKNNWRFQQKMKIGFFLLLCWVLMCGMCSCLVVVKTQSFFSRLFIVFNDNELEMQFFMHFKSANTTDILWSAYNQKKVLLLCIAISIWERK